MLAGERESECEQMLRVCAGLRLRRNAGGADQSPLGILRGFSAQFLALDSLNRSSVINMELHIPCLFFHLRPCPITTHLMSLKDNLLFVSDFTHLWLEIRLAHKDKSV